MLQLYKNIKSKRTELGMTQSELAKKLGYADKSMIAKVEKGNVDLTQSKIIAFAKALETTPSYLMGWESIHPDFDLLDELLHDTEWHYESYSHCDENPNCPLTDDEKITMYVDGVDYDACKKCQYNSGYYYLTNGKEYYKFEEKEFSELSSCLKPYLLFRINEAISKKTGISKHQYEIEEGLCYCNDEEELLVNAAHERTDIEVTDEMRKHDDDLMDGEW